jgi:hypothetical protein
MKSKNRAKGEYQEKIMDEKGKEREDSRMIMK